MSRTEDITRVAREMLRTKPWHEISTRQIATALGIKAPSLYKHVRGMDDVATLLAEAALREYISATASVASASELLKRHREIALSEPNLYKLMNSADFPREKLPAGLEEEAGTPFYLVCNKDPVRAQALWAFAHGCAILEIDSRFAGGAPADGVWDAGLSLVD